MLALDTSAIVSLSLGKVLQQALALVRPVITKTVLKELRTMAALADETGAAALLAIQALRRFRPERVGKEAAAETELILLVKRKKARAIVTDDLRAVRQAEASGADSMFSVHVLYMLMQRGRVTRAEALAALERMRAGRAWKQNVIYQAGRSLLDG